MQGRVFGSGISKLQLEQGLPRTSHDETLLIPLIYFKLIATFYNFNYLSTDLATKDSSGICTN